MKFIKKILKRIAILTLLTLVITKANEYSKD